MLVWVQIGNMHNTNSLTKKKKKKNLNLRMRGRGVGILKQHGHRNTYFSKGITLIYHTYIVHRASCTESHSFIHTNKYIQHDMSSYTYVCRYQPRVHYSTSNPVTYGEFENITGLGTYICIRMSTSIDGSWSWLL